MSLRGIHILTRSPSKWELMNASHLFIKIMTLVREVH